MGMYTWLSEENFERYSKVSDEELNEVFQEARTLIPTVYIGEFIHQEFKVLGKNKTITTYEIYSRCSGEDNDEVRILNIKTSSKDYVANYLFGLLNGYRSAVCDHVNAG